MSKFIQVSLVEEQGGITAHININYIVSIFEHESVTHITLQKDGPSLKVKESVEEIMTAIKVRCG